MQVLVNLLHRIEHRVILLLQELEDPCDALSAVWDVAGALRSLQGTTDVLPCLHDQSLEGVALQAKASEG